MVSDSVDGGWSVDGVSSVAGDSSVDGVDVSTSSVVTTTESVADGAESVPDVAVAGVESERRTVGAGSEVHDALTVALASAPTTSGTQMRRRSTTSDLLKFSSA